MLPVDALGFRRGAGALKTLLADQGLSDHPLFAQAKGRGIHALSGHIESTDVTNDVNGGPIWEWELRWRAGKAAFWDIVGAPMRYRYRRRRSSRLKANSPCAPATRRS